VNHLNSLLREASADAPPEHVDAAAVLNAGRSRVRRRRAVAGVAVVAVAGLALGASVVALDRDRSDQRPAAPPTLLTLDDAVPAEPGRDYEVLETYTSHRNINVEPWDDAYMEGDLVAGVLPDGRVILKRYPNGLGSPFQIALDGTGDTEVVEAPADVGDYLGATDRDLVFASYNRFGLWLLDSTDLQWRQVLGDQRTLDVDLPAQPVTEMAGGTDLIVLPAYPSGIPVPRNIYQVDLDRGVATEISQGGEVAAYGDRVAWTDDDGAAVGLVTVRDERGRTTEFDPGTGDCVGSDLGLTGARIVLMTGCDDKSEDWVTRIDVFDLVGHPVARITGNDLGVVRMTDQFLTIWSSNEGQSDIYTYDLATGSFLRMMANNDLAPSEDGDQSMLAVVGSTLVWQERSDRYTRIRYVVAQMR